MIVGIGVSLGGALTSGVGVAVASTAGVAVASGAAGTSVTSAAGAAVGSVAGVSVGAAAGASVGCSAGASVGSSAGASVGCSAGASVGPELVPQQEFPALAEVLPVSQQPVPLPLLLRMFLLRFQTESVLPSRPQRRYRLLPEQSDWTAGIS